MKKGVFFFLIVSGCFYFDVFCAYGLDIPFSSLTSLWRDGNETMENTILLTTRLPRFFTTFLAGSSLALAGILIQKASNNPLASPSVLGINSSASFLVSLFLLLSPDTSLAGVFGSAFLGAIMGGLFLFWLAKWTYATLFPERLILIGVALGLLMASMTQMILIFDENNMQGLLYWLLGGVEGKTWDHVRILSVSFSLGWGISFFLKRPLEILKIGDDMSSTLGHDPKRTRLLSFMAAILLVAGAVSTCGPIGFVGLIVPHLTQKILDENSTIPLHLTTLMGGIFLVYADFFSRLVQFPFETPVGILSGLIGSIYFLFLSLIPAKGKEVLVT